MPNLARVLSLFGGKPKLQISMSQSGNIQVKAEGLTGIIAAWALRNHLLPVRNLSIREKLNMAD